jgi:2-polyprenyl-3-methyl-5-hydroxy-6-metoxy-1,4-benzoquinol methylase
VRSPSLEPRSAEFGVLYGGVPRLGAEATWARGLAVRLLRRLPASSFRDLFGRELCRRDLTGDEGILLVQTDPEAYLDVPAAEAMLETLQSAGAAAVVPTTNESPSDSLRAVPPFAYHTPTMLREAVLHFRERTARPFRVPHPHGFAFALRAEAAAELDPGLALAELPLALASKGAVVLAEPRAYLHRYGAMDASPRDDLVALLPPSPHSVCDVGCSRGASAAALRRSGVAEIVGIEPDVAAAAEAGKAYDEVHPVRLEAVGREFPGRFDGVLFGDVLEHLEDPVAALSRVRGWLAPRGRVIASSPNVGHWSMIVDLLEGLFDYVPYSILSGTHVRFFTRKSFADVFDAAGLEVDEIRQTRVEPSPAGRSAVERLRRIPGASEDLETVEFTIVARSR